MADELVPASTKSPAVIPAPGGLQPPAIIDRAGGAARFAWDEFFQGEIRNEHTRKAYTLAIRRFLEWCKEQGVDLVRITPGMVGQYFNEHPGGPSTKKQHLAAVRKLFDKLVIRHAVIINPAH